MSSYFFRTVTSSQQLFVQNNYFFRAKFISISYLLRIDSSSGQLRFLNNYFFGGELDQKKDIYWRASFSKQVVLHTIRLFQNSYFFNKGTTSKDAFFQKSYYFKKVTASKEILFHNSYFFSKGTSSKEALFQNSYILEKTNFSEKQYPASPTFSRKLLFQSCYFSKRPYFHSSYFFRKATFLLYTFLTGALFPSNTSMLQLTSYSYQLSEIDTSYVQLCKKCPNTGKYGPEKTPYLDTLCIEKYVNSLLYFV